MMDTDWTWALNTAKRLGAVERELEIVELIKKQPVEISRDALLLLILEDDKK